MKRLAVITIEVDGPDDATDDQLAEAVRYRLRDPAPTLIAARMSAGMSQAGLAEKLGISGSYLSLIEHGRRRATPELTRKLREVLPGHDDPWRVRARDVSVYDLPDWNGA